MSEFRFRRVRFHFSALDPLRLQEGTAANAIRGAFGAALHRTAPPEEYERLFKPRSASGPSGLADLPRPFVLRCRSLEGLDAAAGASFAFDIHFFDVSEAVSSHFERAFRAWETMGLGPERARVLLVRAEMFPPQTISLDGTAAQIERAAIRFLTPTELKHKGQLVTRPEFPILFARIRDRIATLCALFGGIPLAIDFAGLGERSAAVCMTRCDVRWVSRERRSGSTGQVHPLGGFVGEAEYEGPLAEFFPWLQAAQVGGVGRQTVWGKGELRVTT